MSINKNSWPQLTLMEWKDTYDTLHRWIQIVGKIRLALEPMVNHWWNTTLYISPRGLTTSTMPYENIQLQIDFDFIKNMLIIQTSEGDTKTIVLCPKSVADFYHEVMSILGDLDIYIPLWTTPVEIQDRTPFEEDHKHASYDPKYVHRLWQILIQVNKVFKEFRSYFIGKASPVHFFWGAFDLAVTRFSGRTAPSHSGSPNMARFVAVEAYTHEVSSCGFWPGGIGITEGPVFYSYAYPEPNGFRDFHIQPSEAFYHTGMSEFILPYEFVRKSKDPDKVLMAFLQSTYEAAATLSNWDRDVLERHH